MQRALLFITGLTVALTGTAQFELGVGTGLFTQRLHFRDESSGVPYVTNDHPVLPLLNLAFRDRTPAGSNLFIDITYMHRAFFAHLDDSGLGGGTRTDLDVRLDLLYVSVGPEWGGERVSFRLGMQPGILLGGSATGTQTGWAMYPYHGSGEKEISSPARSYFTGDVRVLFALRLTHEIGEHLTLSVDPFASIPLSSLSRSGARLSSLDAGVKVNVLRRFSPRGLWPRIRPKPVPVRP